MRNLSKETAVYLRHMLALVRPGHHISPLTTTTIQPGDVARWKTTEQQLLVSEGQRQLDQQLQADERLRTRAQFLFTTALALLAIMSATLRRIIDEGLAATVLWFVAALPVLFGLLGAAAVLALRFEFKAVDATLMSKSASGDVLLELAQAYASMLQTGENSLNTRLNVFGNAVFLVTLGGAIELMIWFVTLGPFG